MELSQRPVDGAVEDGEEQSGDAKFASEKEKLEALAKAYDEVRAQFAGTQAARTATVFWADAQFQQGNFDAAIEGFEKYLVETKGDDALRNLASEGVGYSWEAKGELDKARAAFEKMSQQAQGEPAKARAAFHVARILQAQGKLQEAATAFDKLKKEFEKTAASREAEERLSALAMQGFSPKVEESPAAPQE